LSELDWHRVSVDEALRRLAVAPKTGLEAAQAQRRAAQFGANRISPPPKRTLRKVIGWVFGGFGSLLLGASIVCFLAWYGTFPLHKRYSHMSTLYLLNLQEAVGEPESAGI
jgi:sodium/potassium-transporting ATPase subunit alpha